jgi:hypothetical protein
MERITGAIVASSATPKVFYYYHLHDRESYVDMNIDVVRLTRFTALPPTLTPPHFGSSKQHRSAAPPRQRV